MGITLIDKSQAGPEATIFPIELSTQGTYNLNSDWQGVDRSQFHRDLTILNSPTFDKQGMTLDGVNQYAFHIIPYDMKSISFWVTVPSVTQTYLLEMDDKRVSIQSGVVVPTGGWTIPTVVVNDVITDTISAGAKQMITVVDQDLHSISRTEIGRMDSDKYMLGKIWHVRIYSRILILDDIKLLYNTEQQGGTYVY